MIDGINDSKILEGYNKLRNIRKKVKNKKILANLIILANLPCVEGIYFQSSVLVVLYSENSSMDFENEKKVILETKNNIENFSHGMYTLRTYSVQDYINPIYFFPSEQYYMNKTIDSGVSLFESQAAVRLKKRNN